MGCLGVSRVGVIVVNDRDGGGKRFRGWSW